MTDHDTPARPIADAPPMRHPARVAAGLIALVLICAAWLGLRGGEAVRAIDAVVGTRWLAGARSAVRVIVRDPSGAAVPDADVRVRLRTGDGTVDLGRARTGPDGGVELDVEVPDTSSAHGIIEILTDGGATLSVPIQIERRAQLLVSSDKPRYRPGETVRWRALLRRLPTMTPISAGTVHVALLDPSGAEVRSDRQPTARFGLADGALPLPDDAASGPWRLRAWSDADRDGVELTLPVAPYERPAFAVEARVLGPGFVLPGKPLELQVVARYPYGEPLDGAHWRLVGASGAGRLDRHGRTRTRVALGKRLPEGLARQTLPLSVEVTDAAGDVVRRALPVVLARQGILIDVAPAGGAWVVSTITATGAPIACDLRVTPQGGSAIRARTDALGLARLELPAGDYHLAATAGDLTGGRSLDARASDLVLRAEPPAPRVGDDVRLTLTGPGDAAHVVVERDGHAFAARTVPLRDGNGELVLPMSRALAGVSVVRAYAIVDGALRERARLPLLVSAAGELRIGARLTGATLPGKGLARLAPGSQATYQLSLADREGNPVVGAVSVVTADDTLRAGLSAGPDPLALADPVDSAPRLHRVTTPAALADPGLSDEQRHALAALLGTQLAGAIETGQKLVSSWRSAREQDREASQRTDRLFGPLAGLVVLVLLGLRLSSHPAAPQILAHVLTAIAGLLLAVGLGGMLPGPVGPIVGAIAWAGCLFAQRRHRPTLPIAAGLLIASGLLTGSVVLIGAGASGSKFDGTVAAPTTRSSMTQIDGEAEARYKPDTVQNQDSGSPEGGAVGAAEVLDTLKTAERRRQSRGWGDDGSARRELAKSEARRRFVEVPLWAPRVITDASGRAEVALQLPDDVAGWRTRLEAVDALGRLGAREHRLATYRSLVLRVDSLDSLSTGDRVELRLTVRNHGTARTAVALSGKASGLTLQSVRPATLTLAPGAIGTAHAVLHATAPGEAHIRLTASARDRTDAVERTVLVRTPTSARVAQASAALSTGALALPVGGAERLRLILYPDAGAELRESLALLQAASTADLATTAAAVRLALTLDAALPERDAARKALRATLTRALGRLRSARPQSLADHALRLEALAAASARSVLPPSELAAALAATPAPPGADIPVLAHALHARQVAARVLGQSLAIPPAQLDRLAQGPADDARARAFAVLVLRRAGRARVAHTRELLSSLTRELPTHAADPATLALIGLVLAEDRDARASARALMLLRRARRPDGGWGDLVATARAAELLLVATPPLPAPLTLTVTLARTRSTATLRPGGPPVTLDLTPALLRSRPTSRQVVRWSPESLAGAATLRWRRSHTANVRWPATVRAGRPFHALVSSKRTKDDILLPLPAGIRPHPRALDQLVRTGALYRWSLQAGALRLSLKGKTLKLPLVARLVGRVNGGTLEVTR